MSEDETVDDERMSPEDTFKILIATDIHLGYEESTNRAQHHDSFNTFEEILGYAKEFNVDFILLGGDLFHDSKPSQIAVMKCMDLLRKYCLGPGSNKIQFLSDPKMIFEHCSVQTVNYEDPNLNVAIPVFSIHGNHDDPSFGTVGSLDVLAVSGLVNYFGKWTNLRHVTIPPLLFKKGASHIALYGLSYIKDQRLARLLRDQKVDMLRPEEEIDNCFNMFVLHQNRVKHSELSYVREEKLPDFLDFIVWGHEHECKISPELVGEKEYYICQPGSPVATSLSEGEAVPKHVGILHVNKTNFKLQKIKLKSVRPFVFDNIILRDHDIKYDAVKARSKSVCDYVDNYVEHVMIPKAVKQITGHKLQPHEPLLRLRIFYEDEDLKFDTFRISQKYSNDVANPMDILLFRKERSDRKTEVKGMLHDDACDDLEEALGYEEDAPEWNKTVQGGISRYFDVEQNKEEMSILSVTDMNDALVKFINNNNTSIFDEEVSYQMKQYVEYIRSLKLKEEKDIRIELVNWEYQRHAEQVEEETAQNRFRQPAANRDIDDTEESGRKSARARGRGGRGSRGGGRGRGRGKATESAKDELDVSTSSSVDHESPKSSSSLKKPTVKPTEDKTHRTTNKTDVLYISDSD